MIVKFFQGFCVTILENKINDWMTETKKTALNQSFKIYSIKQSQSAGSITISVWYSIDSEVEK